MTALRIGTRGSRLALWQANYVADRVRERIAPRPVELVPMQTAGDRDQAASLAQIGGQGAFTKEIQRAVLEGQVDVAVHSLKDLPTEPVPGLILAAVPPRGPAGDVFVSQRHRTFDDLPRRARLATGSLRRRAQLLHRRPDLRVVDIRGNVETRLRKLDEAELDGLVLARAGLERLGLQDVITQPLEPSWMLPAVGQGALGLECRADDAETLQALAALDDPPTRQAVLAEREFLRTLGGGCQVPIAAHARVIGDRLTLFGTVLRADGSDRRDGQTIGDPADAEMVGHWLAEELLADGAGELLRS